MSLKILQTRKKIKLKPEERVANSPWMD
ncbi:mCG1051010 [Mus musculus]|nr:mCG1051010 [Mus musculus]